MSFEKILYPLSDSEQLPSSVPGYAIGYITMAYQSACLVLFSFLLRLSPQTDTIPPKLKQFETKPDVRIEFANS